MNWSIPGYLALVRAGKIGNRPEPPIYRATPANLGETVTLDVGTRPKQAGLGAKVGQKPSRLAAILPDSLE